ncbi:hypothetical protein TcWFU_008955 [Taenia crassiceps]|uniref:Uncharacterized protein n=1 Tax=Taenia crassiceps TaxID=6207 RepID=A0ABR4Q3A5_9CEST
MHLRPSRTTSLEAHVASSNYRPTLSHPEIAEQQEGMLTKTIIGLEHFSVLSSQQVVAPSPHNEHFDASTRMMHLVLQHPNANVRSPQESTPLTHAPSALTHFSFLSAVGTIAVERVFQSRRCILTSLVCRTSHWQKPYLLRDF